MLHRDWGGTGEDMGLTAARFRFSSCFTVTLHLAFPSFFPLVFLCTNVNGPQVPHGRRGRQGAIWE